MQTFDFQKFLPQLNNIGDEEGFFKTIPLRLGEFITAAGVNVDATGSDAAHLLFNADGDDFSFGIPIPLDYDSTRDYCKILMLAERTSGSGTSTFAVGNLWRAREGATAIADILGGSTKTMSVASDSIDMYELDLSELGLLPLDVISALVDHTRGSSTDVKAYGLWFKYRSTLVASDTTARE